ERAAAERIFALLPIEQGSALRHLWEEFMARQSEEAKFARALDRLQPMLENMKTGGGTSQRHGVTADKGLARVERSEAGWPPLGAFARNTVMHAAAPVIIAPAPE